MGSSTSPLLFVYALQFRGNDNVFPDAHEVTDAHVVTDFPFYGFLRRGAGQFQFLLVIIHNIRLQNQLTEFMKADGHTAGSLEIP